MLSNTTVDMPIFLSPRLKVKFWEVRKLIFLLQSFYYAAVQILSGSKADCMEIIILKDEAKAYSRCTHVSVHLLSNLTDTAAHRRNAIDQESRVNIIHVDAKNRLVYS